MPRCAVENCEVAETAVCLEGHKQGCPNLLPEDKNTDHLPNEVTQLLTDVELKTESYQFHTGEKLTISEASRLMNERPTRVVLCVGAQFSGKTTFLARLGEMFRDGTSSDYGFAGSLTLCAFERASWLATITSGANRPDTRRTDRRENDTFYHLRVYPKDDASGQLDILLSDLAGETFPDAVGSLDFCANLNAISRADHLVIFLDCEKLASHSLRHPETNNAREFLQRVCSVKHQLRNLCVQVIFSRWDYITSKAEMATILKYCNGIETDFTERFASSFAELVFLRIAARPDDGSNPTNDKIQSLFAHWIEIPLFKPQASPARNRQPVRDFCAFGVT